MSIAKRNVVIDIIKGIGICLMVCGHSGCPATNWIYLFHMSLFFIASGYLWNEKNSSSTSSLKKYVIRKIKSLWIPFIVINLFYTITFNIFYSWGLYSSVSGEGIIPVVPLDVTSFIKQIFLNILFSGGSQLAGATWFLRSLFCISIANAIIVFVLNKLNLSRCYFAIFFLTIVGAYLANDNTFFREILGTIGLESFFAGYYAFLLGVFFRKIDIFTILNKFKNVLLVVTFVLLTILNNFGTIQLNVGHIENILFYTLVSILGWCFIASLSTTISSINLCKFFVYVSQKSLWIIGLHFLSFKLVSLCIIVFKQGILSELAYYPTINQLQYVWLLYTLVGILVPLVIEKKFEKLSRLISIFFRRSIS